MCTKPIVAYRLKESFFNETFCRFDFSHLKFLMLNGYYLSHLSFKKRFLTDNGKMKIFFNTSMIPSELSCFFEEIFLPCGKCDECLLRHAQMWSVRCQHEAEFHNDMCFLTFTYDDLHCPRNEGVPTVFYPDIQQFFKRLRSKLKYYGFKGKVRYFVCQEYGGETFRPHFHVILYGYIPPDSFNRKYLWKRGRSGMPVYRSPLFESIWNRGMVFLGSVTKFACGYVARYTLEKSKHKHTKDFYKYRFKEKLGMSRREGIGIQWFKQHYKNVMLQGYIRDLERVKVKYPIPRAYLNYAEKNYSKFYWNEFMPIRKKMILDYQEELKRNIKCTNDYINFYKHKKLYKKEVVKKLKRTLRDDDFIEFETYPMIFKC